MKREFDGLGISSPILKALHTMGFETPTEVQLNALPYALKQEDLVVRSKTGSGKTAVFGITMLQLIEPEANSPHGLILTPTRELAVQVDNDIKHMARYLKHKTTAIYGQHNMNTEIEALNGGVSIVTGTPGRVFDHIRQGNLVTKHIRFLVLDEADRMLDMGFMDQVVRIIKTLPRERVTMLFSATIPPEIRNICRNFMKSPVNIEIESSTMTVSTTQQLYYRVKHNEKNTWLNRLLLMERPESCIIFCNTRSKVDRVQYFLASKGYACRALHGDIPQSKRLKTMQQFKRGAFSLLVATDVAARGIHVDDLSLVINYDVPIERDSYVHRIGRTGRAGHGGRAISLVTGEDIMSLYEIEEHIGVMIPQEELPTEADFNLQTDEVEKWKQENAQKNRSLRASMDANVKKAPPKHMPAGRKRTQPQRRTHKEKMGGADKPYNVPAGAAKIPEARQPREQRHEPQPAASHTVKTGAVYAPPNKEAPQKQTAKDKKPFLRRIFEKIGVSFNSRTP